MLTIEDLFKPHTAKATGFAKHTTGDITYVTNGLRNNGVVGFVKAIPGDVVYRFLAIALSSFCEATVQIPPFIARGNGGSGLMVLEPLKPMTVDQLAYIAAYINTNLRWRYNWYRQATVDRIRRLAIPDVNNPPVRLSVKSLLPAVPVAVKSAVKRLKLASFPLDSLFQMTPGDYHNASVLPEGDTPLISCGDRNNGIMAFVSVPAERVYRYKLTVAFNGMNTLTTKFHPYDFATKDDVAVCTPLKPLRPATLFVVQIMMNRERWRYNFYRKCFIDKLRRQNVELPAYRDAIDEDAMEAIAASAPYWPFLKKRFALTQ